METIITIVTVNLKLYMSLQIATINICVVQVGPVRKLRTKRSPGWNERTQESESGKALIVQPFLFFLQLP